ncbi:MAG: type II toxin-antitoxin system RelE/ParE family toxin [Proteobacteria bacterium]|nr:type II toxin-antitoxin system RelE/ParE family toxin [Pseudomonadota bacterium]
MTLNWSPEALQDLRDIRAYISQDNPDAAKRLVTRIVTAVSTQLPSNPSVGRAGRVYGTRELVIANAPFVVPYRIREEDIDILRVYHNARMWPEVF